MYTWNMKFNLLMEKRHIHIMTQDFKSTQVPNPNIDKGKRKWKPKASSYLTSEVGTCPHASLFLHTVLAAT